MWFIVGVVYRVLTRCEAVGVVYSGVDSIGNSGCGL